MVGWPFGLVKAQLLDVAASAAVSKFGRGLGAALITPLFWLRRARIGWHGLASAR